MEFFCENKTTDYAAYLKISKFPCCLTVGYLLRRLKVKKQVRNDSVSEVTV
jgi:hypothetical protein